MFAYHPTADDLANWARSGVVSLTGHSTGPPLVPPGNAATLASRICARMADVTASSRHSLILDGPALLAERAAFTGHRRQGRISAGGKARLLPTSDGWAVLSCARAGDPQLLAALVGAELPPDPWPDVTAWLRSHTGDELAERAELLGLAAGPIRRGGTPTMPRRPGSCQGRSPEGLLVVDFSALWAGPLCAHLLGLAGARIVKVETPQRMDGARRGNRAFFDLLHAGHRAVMLDPTTRNGRRALAGLVKAADIVIEASRPRALAGFGIDAKAVAELGTVWISITAAGRDSGRIGFGDDVAAAAGLVACDERRSPVFCGDALADPLTGLVAAELAMSSPAPGVGTLIDIAMSGVVAATLSSRGPRPAVEARRGNVGWVVDTDSGPVPVAAPRRRNAAGRAPGPGEHTNQVLRELGIPRP